MSRRKEFEAVFQKGLRIPGPLFTGFCLDTGSEERGKIGFAVPRSLGKSVVRNRIKRRLREAVRLNLHLLPAGWNVVLQAKKTALDASFDELQREVVRLFSRCKGC